jgi:Protein of unknown function (DUF1631)
MQPAYAALLTAAVSSAEGLLTSAFSKAMFSMRSDVQPEGEPTAQQTLALALQCIDRFADQLCVAYPMALRDAHHQHTKSGFKQVGVSLTDLNIEQLELMDPTQVQERIERVRALQHILLVAGDNLAALDAHFAALEGMEQVNPARNPLRPDVYLSVLQSVMTRFKVPRVVRVLWLQHLSGPLATGLNAAYAQWRKEFHIAGVSLAKQSVAGAGGAQLATSASVNRPQGKAQVRETLLTLERLRSLIAGEYEPQPKSPVEAFARKFAREFESARKAEADLADSQFSPTIPAAYETLQELKQVEEVVQRIEQRPNQAASLFDSKKIVSERDRLFQQAKGIGQRLSLEVVALMVDNLVTDSRLLAPIRQAISRLELALLRLVLIDVRFFTDRHHPARVLLQELSERGLAFGSQADPQFNFFLVSLQRHLSPLEDAQIDGEQPFEAALRALRLAWRESAMRAGTLNQIHDAVAALEDAEKRHVQAQRIATGMRAIPGFANAPQGIVDFLLGPWAQVAASAQLADKSGEPDPGGYKAIVKPLIWSAHPELASKDVAKLTSLVPRLLGKLREGLRLIDYPAVKTSAFFDLLMRLHQQAFRPAAIVQTAQQLEPAAVQTLLPDDIPLWVAPAEALASGFMVMDEDDKADHKGKVPPDLLANLDMSQGVASADSDSGVVQEALVEKMAVGTWVELLVKGAWSRTQLGWISPQRTMYLFTSAQGKTQSMTRRVLTRLMAAGELRLLSERSVVDGALDAVVHTATLNSLDLRLE